MRLHQKVSDNQIRKSRSGRHFSPEPLFEVVLVAIAPWGAGEEAAWEGLVPELGERPPLLLALRSLPALPVVFLAAEPGRRGAQTPVGEAQAAAPLGAGGQPPHPSRHPAWADGPGAPRDAHVLLSPPAHAPCAVSKRALVTHHCRSLHLGTTFPPVLTAPAPPPAHEQLGKPSASRPASAAAAAARPVTLELLPGPSPLSRAHCHFTQISQFNS